LKGRQRTPRIGAELSIDFTRGKAFAVEEDLKRQRVATRVSRTKRATALLLWRGGNGRSDCCRENEKDTQWDPISHVEVNCTFRASTSARRQPTSTE